MFRNFTKIMIAVFVVFVSVSAWAGFFGKGKVIEVQDVTREQVIVLESGSAPGAVHGIRINITGHLEGSATIQRAYESKPMYDPKLISGNVRVKWGGDWYGDKCLLIYKPVDVTGGHLKIEYDFRTTDR